MAFGDTDIETMLIQYLPNTKQRSLKYHELAVDLLLPDSPVLTRLSPRDNAERHQDQRHTHLTAPASG